MGKEGVRPDGGDEMAEDTRPRIPAGEILAKIEKGEPVKYDGVVIEGDLDLSKLNLPTEHVERTDLQKMLLVSEDVKVVASSILIIKSHIQGHLDFSNSSLSDSACFSFCTFEGVAKFVGSIFKGRAEFAGSIFLMPARFDDSRFDLTANFFNSTFKEEARFDNSVFTGAAIFGHSTFEGSANFERSTFKKGAYFVSSMFTNEIVTFKGAVFSEDAKFLHSVFKVDNLDFRETRFSQLEDQEFPCRRAKQLAQNLGDKDEADYYYYREMVGRRIRLQNENIKPWTISFPIIYTITPDTRIKQAIFKVCKYLKYNIFEMFFVHWIFGYGVHPWRILFCWLGFVALFAIIFCHYQAIDEIASQMNATATAMDYLWFSIATAVTPGYAGYRPDEFFKIVAGIEAIIGTFMGAAFIITFARKYMR